MYSRFAAAAMLLLLAHQSLLAKVEVFPGKQPLANYTTYKWGRTRLFTNSQGFTEDDPLVTPTIKAAVNAQLAKAGMREVAENPDFEINTLAMGQAVPNVDIMMFGINNTPTVNSMAAFSPGVQTIQMGRYNKEGTLAVHFIDPKTNTSVWLGIVTKSLGKPEKLESDINKAVADLFKKFKR